MATTNAIVRTDLMHGTDNPADLVSVKYQVSDVNTAIENGNVVVVGGLLTGEREVRKATKPTATTPLNQLALIATPEMIYDETPRKTFADFINEAGVPARGYRLRSGDVFSATMEAFGGRATLGDVVVGDIVETQADTKLNIVATLTASSTQVGKVIAKEGNYVVVAVD